VAENSRPTGRRQIHEPFHRGKESQICHVVGLVENRHFDRPQLAKALSNQVLKTSGAGDEYVDASAQGTHLTGLRYATEDRGGSQTQSGSQRGHGVCHLRCKFARRHENERARRTGLTSGARRCQFRHHRNGECDGLARPGPTSAEHVATGKAVGQGTGLDRERFGDPAGGQYLADLGRGAKCSEWVDRSDVFRAHRIGGIGNA
jgi:hypothetical protein